MKLREIFVTDFGEIDLPETPPVRLKHNGWPDRRYKEGRRYLAYLNHIADLAKEEWVRGGWLVTPPAYSEWVRGR